MATAKETAQNVISDIKEKFEKFITALEDKLSGNDEVTEAKVLEVKQHAAAGLANLAGTIDTSGANVPLDPSAPVANTNATGSDTINKDSKTLGSNADTTTSKPSK